MKKDWHYYEAHVTLGKMCQKLTDEIPEVLTQLGFKTTDIVSMPYEGLETEEFDVVLTTKDSHLKTLTTRVQESIMFLKDLGYDVRRYKIESTIIDSKYDDVFEYWGA